MIPKRYQTGAPPSTCPAEILALLRTSESMSMQELRYGLRYRYCPRTVQKHLTTLRSSGTVECFVADGNMRRLRYRVVKR